MTPEGNKAIVSRLVEDLFNTGDLDVVDEVLADEYVDHTASDPDLPGPENVKRSVSEWLTAFPDTVSVVKDMVAEGDKVAARWTTQATHRSEFMDVPPSGNRIDVTWFGIPEDADEAVSFLSNQVRCVANVARRQDEGGALVVGRSFPTPNASREVMLPKLSGSRWTASSSRPRATLRSTSASTRRTP